GKHARILDAGQLQGLGPRRVAVDEGQVGLAVPDLVVEKRVVVDDDEGQAPALQAAGYRLASGVPTGDHDVPAEAFRHVWIERDGRLRLLPEERQAGDGRAQDRPERHQAWVQHDRHKGGREDRRGEVAIDDLFL